VYGGPDVARDAEYVVRAFDVNTASVVELVRTTATVHSVAIDPAAATVFYFASEDGAGTGSGVWSVPSDGSAAPTLLLAPPAVGLSDAVLAAQLTFRATMAVSVEGDRVAIQECVRRCRLVILNVRDATSETIDLRISIEAVEGLAGDRLVGTAGVVDLATGTLVGEVVAGTLVADADGRPLLLYEDLAGIAASDVETGQSRHVRAPARVSLYPSRAVGAELPQGWVLAVRALVAPGQASSEWVALSLTDGVTVPLPMLMPIS
jgi:hypothetical protein